MRKLCRSMPLSEISIDYLPATVNPRRFGMHACNWLRSIIRSIGDGFRNRSFRGKPNANSICTVSPFRPCAIGTCSPGRRPSIGTQGDQVGEFHEDGESLIVSGRKVRAIHRLRNKKLAEMQRLQSKCTKGSRQWKKVQRAKRYIRSKSERQLRDALHKTTMQFVDWCVQQSVSDVHLGDVEGVQRNSRKEKRLNRKQAQKLSNWSMGKVKQYLAYKLKREGIALHPVDESYTSQTCPVCRKRNRTASRNDRCACGYRGHRDLHGARNILSKARYDEFLHFDAEIKMKYLRIA